jgi:murein DD-endopeptidase MepM/ murein hydrolase activator NlpD
LDGKEVSITIKEKDIIVVDADADVPVTEAKENGAELTILKATVENGIAKVKVKLRPKADEDLKTWKEKLANGKEDGTHKYTVKSPFKVSGDLDKIAGSIEKKSNDALAPKHIVKKEDISKLLTEGASYTATDSFDLPKYKKEKTTENLWLKAECQGDTKKHEGEFLKKDGEYFVIGKKCECEARVRAFIRMLRVGEGTDGEKGYTRQFSGKQFSDMSNHPHEVITSGGYSSSAAGAYQIMGDTYDGLKTYRTKYNILNFDQESQDKLCLVILKHNYTTDRPNSFYNPVYWKDDAKTIRDTEKEKKASEKRKRFKGQNGDIVQMLIDNNYDKAVLLSALCWASLPDSPYGQPTGTKEECKANYEKFLKEELAGKSDLYLKKGFLKEFEYACCSDNKGSAKWQNPLKNSQITIYTFGGSKRPWRSAFGRVRTDMTGTDNGARPHHGLDLFANIGTEVYACLPGEIVSLTPGTGYGNGFVFKIDAGYLDEFIKQRRDYSPYYIKSKRTYDSQKYDITGYGDFEEYEGISESTGVYLMYAHLSEVLVNLNEKITESNMDKVLGKTGTSGATNTKGPHLHFEIRSKQNPSGYTERYNPAFYIDYKNENQLTDAERENQDTAMGQ